MRPLLLASALLLAAPAAAQPAAPAPAPQPPAQPTVALTLQELDFLIQQAADTPARFSFQALQLLLAKRQQAEPKAP